MTIGEYRALKEKLNKKTKKELIEIVISYRKEIADLKWHWKWVLNGDC